LVGVKDRRIKKGEREKGDRRREKKCNSCLTAAFLKGSI